MSLQTKKSKSFIDAIEEVARKYLDTSFNGSVATGNGCSYDGNPYSRRDYVLDCTVSKNWNGEKSRELRKRLKEVGAINIIGGVQKADIRYYLDLAFDIDPNRLKEYLAKDEEAKIAREKEDLELKAKFEAERKARRESLK